MILVISVLQNYKHDEIVLLRFLLQMLLYPHCLLPIDLLGVLVTKIAHVLCFWIAVHHRILGVALVLLV